MIDAARRGIDQRRRRGQGGFTLIELMVALAISSILVMMVLSVFSRMSSAYRRQQQVASLQSVLSAAQNMLAQDARQAGFQTADGFQIATRVGSRQRPVKIVNNSTSPDEIYFYSADAGRQVRVDTIATNRDGLTVDNGAGQFSNGELAMLVNTSTTAVMVAGVSRVIPKFESCLVQIGLVGSNTSISLSQTLPFGAPSNYHCADVATAHENNKQTMLYRFRARGYRIDPTRSALGVLQLSPSGGLVANDWQDMGIGFADLQIAARMFRDPGLGDVDGDGDSQYNWYSAAAMASNTDENSQFRITRLTINISARTDRAVDGVGAAATPAFIVAARPAFNHLGDRTSVVLNPSDRVYRYTTSRIDLRNAGAGL